MGDHAQRQDHTRRSAAKLGGEVAIAAPDFLRQGLVLRRQALYRVADAAVGQHQGIVGALGDRLAGEAEGMQRPVEQDARMIAGKRPSGAVGAVHARREADDQQAGGSVPECGHGSCVIGGMVQPHPIEKACEPWAVAAIDAKAVWHEVRCA